MPIQRNKAKGASYRPEGYAAYQAKHKQKNSQSGDAPASEDKGPKKRRGSNKKKDPGRQQTPEEDSSEIPEVKLPEALDDNQLDRPPTPLLVFHGLWLFFLFAGMLLCTFPECQSMGHFRNYAWYIQFVFYAIFFLGYFHPRVMINFIYWGLFPVHGLVWLAFVALPVLGSSGIQHFIRKKAWMEKLAAAETNHAVGLFLLQVVVAVTLVLLNRKRVCCVLHKKYPDLSKWQRRINCIYQITSPAALLMIWDTFFNPGVVYGIDYLSDLPFINKRGWLLILLVCLGVNGTMYAFFWRAVAGGAITVGLAWDPVTKKIVPTLVPVYDGF